MHRYFEFRGSVDRKTLHVLYSRNYKIQPTQDNPVRYIIDGGANIGDQTLRFRHFYKDAEIIAVEPDRGNFELLSRNFGTDPKTHIVNAAIWNADGLVSLRQGADSVSHSVKSQIGETTAVTISHLIENYKLPHIDILKLDVESAEVEVFSTAEHWANQVNAVIVEPHDRMKDGCGFAIIRPFLSLGFNLFISGENLVLIRRGLGWSLKEELYY